MATRRLTAPVMLNPYPEVRLSKLRNFLFRKGNNLADVEDIIQDTFLRAFKFFKEGGKINSSLEAFLVSLARNRAVDLHRRSHYRGAHQSIPLMDARPEELSSEIPDLFDQVSADQLLLHFRQLLKATHPPITCRIFFLFVLEEYTYKEIGKLLHMPERTVEKHIERAYRTLAESENKSCARKKTSKKP